jgi:hypothetical protein
MQVKESFRPENIGESVDLEMFTLDGTPMNETIEATAMHIDAETIAKHAAIWEQLQTAKDRLMSLLDTDAIRPENGVLIPEYVQDVDAAINTIVTLYSLKSPELAENYPITFEVLKAHLKSREQGKYLPHKNFLMLSPEGLRVREKEKYMLVPTELIVSTVSRQMNTPINEYGNSSEIPGWHNMYSSRQGSCEAITNGLVTDPKKTLEKAMGEGTNGFEVRLQQVDGPDGPIYIVFDGSHRVGIAKAMDIPYVLAKVVKTQAEVSVTGTEKDKAYWEALIDINILRGNVSETNLPDGTSGYQLDVVDIGADAIYPWIVNSYSAPINAMYKRLYPNSSLGTVDLHGQRISNKIATILS